MQPLDTLISYTNSQLLVGSFIDDELIGSVKIDDPESLSIFVSSDSNQNSQQKSYQQASFSKVTPLTSPDSDRDYIQNDSYCDITQKIDVEPIISLDFKNDDINQKKNITQTKTQSSTTSTEKPRVYNLALKTEEIEMPSDRVSNNALVMHLKFEQTSGTQAIDSSSIGTNKGELRNGATFKNVGAPLNGTVSFDGFNDYIHVKDSNKINTTTVAKRTISLWFRVNDKNLSSRKQVLYEEGGIERGLAIYVDSGRLYVGGWNNQNSQNNWQGTYLSTGAISSNKWHHVTLVLNAKGDTSTPQSGALAAYLDGKKFGTGNGSRISSHDDDIGVGGLSQDTQFHDGDEKGTGTNGLRGSIDDVRIYNRVLSDNEIAVLASGSPKNTNPSTPTPKPTSTSSNSFPVASGDRVTTKEDTPITISNSKLLANDKDANGDSLKIVSVSNAINGDALLGNNGKIIFNPKEDFSGNASFQYTVSDNRGGTAKATVTVSVLGQPEPSSSSVQMGVNLAKIADWSTQLPFADAFKSSRAWMTQDPQKFVWNTNETNRLQLDSNGWVKYVPKREDPAVAYTAVGTLMYREMEGKYPGGKYIVLYKGEGSLAYDFDAKKDVAASSPGRDVINVTPSNSGIWLQIRESDPKRTGNYIRDIQVIPAAYENTYQNQVFNPKFIEKIKDFDALRFMEWMKTNNSEQSQWSSRPTPQMSNYSQKGVSVEVMVQLANQTDTNPWFTLPHQVSDEYVTNFARYVRDNLESGRKVYVEYSNEVWNVNFGQSKWALEQAKKLWPGSKKSDNDLRLDYYSKRTTEIMQIWDREFGANKDKVIGIMGGQANSVGVVKQALSYEWTSQPKSNKDYGIDAVAIAPYYGYYLGSPSNSSEIQSWTRDADGGRKKLFDEITQGGVLSKGPSGGALQQAYDWMAAHAELANQEGLQLLAYEGGSHVTGIYGTENNTAITKLFIEAHRDSRMGEIYKDYLQKWYELGGDLFVNYKDIFKPSKWGSWGLLENLDQTSSPRYDAVMDIIRSS